MNLIWFLHISGGGGGQNCSIGATPLHVPRWNVFECRSKPRLSVNISLSQRYPGMLTDVSLGVHIWGGVAGRGARQALPSQLASRSDTFCGGINSCWCKSVGLMHFIWLTAPCCCTGEAEIALPRDSRQFL